MTIPIRILTATNGSDFSERDIIIVGQTDNGASKALMARLKRQWDVMTLDGKDFYHNSFEDYAKHWDVNMIGGQLEP